MFTGIIEAVGKVTGRSAINGGWRFTIIAPEVLTDVGIGDSICVNGVCLTVVALSGEQFSMEAVGETLEKTNIGDLLTGDEVNLERAMAANGRFGGHVVQGHINGTARITRWEARGDNWVLEVEVPERLLPYIILEGSIALDGISLTVAALDGATVRINIIPHTVNVTNLHRKKKGDSLNVEVDVIAKYVENMLRFQKRDEESIDESS